MAVQASRISTSLHKQGQPGEFPGDIGRAYFNPINTFFGKRKLFIYMCCLVCLFLAVNVISKRYLVKNCSCSR